MISITITTDLGAHPWKDLRHVGDDKFGTIERIGRLPMGTVQGNSTVSIAIRLPDGTQCMAQTTMKNFLDAAVILRAADQTGKS